MHRCARASFVGVSLCHILLLCTFFAAVKAAATDIKCNPQCINGDCTAYLGNLSCECHGNWSGEDCSTFVCDLENKCLNGGTCFPNPKDVTRYLCACQLPYFGDICQYTLEGSSCASEADPCNGSTCYDLQAGGHQCICSEGWWGVGCNYSVHAESPMDRCFHYPNLCGGHGQCIWSPQFHTFFSGCKCDPGYAQTNNCEQTLSGADYCPSNGYCSPGSTCNNVFRNVPKNNSDTGEYEVVYDVVDYFCKCDGTHQGKNCSEAFDICNPDPCGPGTCIPILGGHYYKCECPPDRMGYNCELFNDPCENFLCENAGTCVRESLPNSDGSYNSSGVKCMCCAGFDGNHCEINIGRNHTLCLPDPCQNGGHCSFSEESYECKCERGYTGANCEYSDLCLSSPCVESNMESCLTTAEGFVCICKTGWGGRTCNADIDECHDPPNPCLNGGLCVNSHGSYSCSCPPKFTGQYCGVGIPQPVNCRSSQMCKNGGTCVDQEGGTMVCECPPGFIGDVCEVLDCQYDDCASLATNGLCDMKCFTEECGFDGGEGFCLAGNASDPWENCNTADLCRRRSENTKCDPECNSRDCLFDSYECVPQTECPADIAAQCVNSTGDGVCDDQCNTVACPFDSEDCGTQDYIKDRLVVYILGSAGQSFYNNKTAQKTFELLIGDITNTHPDILDIELLGTKDGLDNGIIVPEGRNLYRVTLRLDLEYCSDQCVKSVEEAVKFLDAYYASGKDLAGYEYVKSESTKPGEEPTEGTPKTQVAIGVTIVVVAVLGLFVVGGVLIGKRKTIRARIFYPGQSQVDDSGHDPPPPNKKRKMAHTELSASTLVNSTEESSIAASGSSGDYIREGSRAAKMDNGKITWTDFRVPVENSPVRDPSNTAVVSQVGQDPRKWNYLHYSAVRNPQIMRQLLERCRGEDGKKWDVNTPGPGGYTPLMLAITQKNTPSENFSGPSRSSSSSDSSTEISEQNNLLSPLAKNNQLVPRSDTCITPLTNGSTPSSPLNCSVDALLGARVHLDATNDYGRTALHLAAVCARGDYVKKLLSVGANPNVQDNWGQSPLHASVGAAAEGAFHILTNFAKTDINLKSDGGTTPLMDAVKATNIYMVKQLVKKNADISITDYEGRTAVHWAAMVNNVEALKLLIRQGPDTIKDAQDIKGQTALFLACREGAAECAKHLLDVFANATLLDNLDRSPMIMAYERQHHHIMEMLKSHGPYHYQLPANGRHAHAVPHHVQMVHPEMALRQQVSQHSMAYPSPHDMMMEMQQMHMPDHFGAGHSRPSHHSPEMQPQQGQTFGDLGYPVSSAMDLGLPGSASFKSAISTPIFFSNTMHSVTESSNVHAPAAAPHFYPPSTSSQLPPSTKHPSPPTTYHQHSSPPTQEQPHSTSDLAMTYSQPLAVPPNPTYPTYPTSTSHFPVSNTVSDSEQRMVSELITSISNDLPPQQSASTLACANNATRPLQHIDIETNLPGYPATIPTSDPYAPTSTQQPPQQQLYSPPQQPNSASSVHSNRSPSALYPSPPNSDTLQHSEVAQQSGMAMAYAHASPPSLTPSPETRDELARHSIATVEGLVQQHDYPSMMYGGVDSYNYGGIRFAQDYSNETTV